MTTLEKQLIRFGFIFLAFVVLVIGIFCMRDLYNENPVAQLMHLWLSVALLMASALMFFLDWRLALYGIAVVVVTGFRFPVF